MRKLCTLLVLIMLLTCIPMTGCTAKANPATDFEYEVNEAGDAIYLQKYIGTSEDVVIPAEIDGLPVRFLKGISEDRGDYMSTVGGVFEGSSIKSVVIPDSVTSIGQYAFRSCENLKKVTVGSSLKVIAFSAFQFCTSLEKIDLSKTELQIIGTLAFKGCTALSEIQFSDCLTTIEDAAFYDCTALTALDFPESLTTIGQEAFLNCTSLKEIIVPTKLSLMSLDRIRFYNLPALERIVFTPGRTEITGYAFFDTTTNVEIVIPAGVEKFSPLPFFVHGPAKFIFLGDCPTTIADEEFYGEPTIYYDPDTDGWDTCVWREKYPLAESK